MGPLSSGSIHSVPPPHRLPPCLVAVFTQCPLHTDCPPVWWQYSLSAPSTQTAPLSGGSIHSVLPPHRLPPVWWQYSLSAPSTQTAPLSGGSIHSMLPPHRLPPCPVAVFTHWSLHTDCPPVCWQYSLSY